VSLMPVAICHRRRWLPPVLLTPVANFPSVSTTQAELVVEFAASVVETGGAPWLANISANFRKKLERPNVIFRGLLEVNSWKKSEAKNLVTLSL
jgi:hypothetical protein